MSGTYRYWTKEEDKILLDRYGKCSTETLCETLGRSENSIVHRLNRLEGTMSVTVISGNMTTKDVSEIMGIHISTVRSLMKTSGLPFIRPNKLYLIPEELFWKWLKNNLNKVRYSAIDDSIELITPPWYQDEIKNRKRNFTKAVIGVDNRWSSFEETVAWNMFLKGYSNQEIANELKRTVIGVKNKLQRISKNKMKKAS